MLTYCDGRKRKRKRHKNVSISNHLYMCEGQGIVYHVCGWSVSTIAANGK